jgi:hypothetical protein
MLSSPGSRASRDALALATAFVPPASVESPLQYEVKMIVGTVVFVGFAAALPAASTGYE